MLIYIYYITMPISAGLSCQKCLKVAAAATSGLFFIDYIFDSSMDSIMSAAMHPSLTPSQAFRRHFDN